MWKVLILPSGSALGSLMVVVLLAGTGAREAVMASAVAAMGSTVVAMLRRNMVRGARRAADMAESRREAIAMRCSVCVCVWM